MPGIVQPREGNGAQGGTNGGSGNGSLGFNVETTTTNMGSNTDKMEIEAARDTSMNVQRYRLKANQVFDSSNALDMNYRIAESQFLRYVQKMEGKYEIESVDYFINPDLVHEFHLKKLEFEEKYGKNDLSSYILAFHGTDPANVHSISQSNFQMERSQRGTFGRGIYLSEIPHVSMGYGGSLFLCKVLPGLSYNVTEQMYHAPLQPGYDSHRVMEGSNGYSWALVIFNPKQILPCYLINYKAVRPIRVPRMIDIRAHQRRMRQIEEEQKQKQQKIQGMDVER